jgi:4-amino-4-deoxy-L-arabinose transferase-like glycosyltransferase
MAVGLTPRDEFGLRVFDALFAAAAFAYVMAFGWRLGGLLCGGVALLVLYTIDPLLFLHGLRTNNMEAALFLAYCGGIYHGYRWFVCDRSSVRRLHALAVAIYGVLGFMTKFVAVAFLPIVLAAGLLMRRGAAARLRQTWSDWLLPTALAAILVLPWFVYQWRTHHDFWGVLFTQHVVTRMTASLDPGHLEPWHFYFTRTWNELQHGDSLLLGLAGIAALLFRTLRRDLLPQLLLAWWLIPFVLISFGASKLVHYAYPFLPPIALGAGLACAMAVSFVERRLRSRISAEGASSDALPWPRWQTRVRSLLVLLGLVVIGLAIWTLVAGPRVTVAIAGVDLLRNSSVLRPLLIGCLLLFFCGYFRATVRAAAVALVVLFLPVEKYEERVRYTRSIEHPLRAARDCLLDAAASLGTAPAGVFVPDPALLPHPYYFYLHRTGPWRTASRRWEDEVAGHLSSGSTVVITADQWRALTSRSSSPALPAGVTGVWVDQHAALLLPAPSAACLPRIVAASRFAHTRGLPSS